jgi:hypothetical protein
MLNPFQARQYMAILTEDVEAGRFRHVRIKPFACEVPGMLAAMLTLPDGMPYCHSLLYPAPRPVPRDPLFQQPEAVRDQFPLFAILGSQPKMVRDPAWAYILDAPGTMPAGALQFFDFGDDAYGAMQMTVDREALDGLA